MSPTSKKIEVDIDFRRNYQLIQKRSDLNKFQLIPNLNPIPKSYLKSAIRIQTRQTHRVPVPMSCSFRIISF